MYFTSTLFYTGQSVQSLNYEPYLYIIIQAIGSVSPSEKTPRTLPSLARNDTSCSVESDENFQVEERRAAWRQWRGSTDREGQSSLQVDREPGISCPWTLYHVCEEG